MKHIELVCELMLSIQRGDVINKKAALDRVMKTDDFSAETSSQPHTTVSWSNSGLFVPVSVVRVRLRPHVHTGGVRSAHASRISTSRIASFRSRLDTLPTTGELIRVIVFLWVERLPKLTEPPVFVFLSVIVGFVRAVFRRARGAETLSGRHLSHLFRMANYSRIDLPRLSRPPAVN